MIALGTNARVFLCLGATDLRKGADGLAMMVSSHLGQDPFAGNVFAFCNRSRTAIKLLVWDRNGFWVFHKRLERQRFRWPAVPADVLEWTTRELNWLLDGLDPLRVAGHERLSYSTIC